MSFCNMKQKKNTERKLQQKAWDIDGIKNKLLFINIFET